MADPDPLYGARLRHERAREHLLDIRHRVEAVYENFGRVGAGRHPKTGGYAVMFPEVEQPPPTLSVRVGELLYNLRAALDYVVFELARLDSGAVQDGTQFPIEDRQKVFYGRRRSTYLKGVSDEHVALIESYQPYKGCNWTGLLRSLSNPDKHRALHLLVSQVDDEIEIYSGHSFQADEMNRISHFGAKTETGMAEVYVGRSRNMKVNLELTASVTFDEGPPIVETLEEMQIEVEALVERFRAEFR